MRALIKYLITLVVGGLLTLWMAVSRGVMEPIEPVKLYHILCDSFFVVGFFITAIGVLVFVSNEGAFDGIVYSVRAFVNIFRKNKRKHESYYDFRTARAEHKFSFGFLLICGAVFLAISAVMYVLYSKYV